MKLLVLPINHFYLKFRAKLLLVKFNVTHCAAIFNRLRVRRSLPCRRRPPCHPVASHLGHAMVLQGIRCVCGCQPSCRWFGVYVVVRHRAIGLL